MTEETLSRSELLFGREVMTLISKQRVILFGVGGVGSWCAESLVRSGIRHLSIVDSDRICASNCNRQLMATPATVGHVKVEAMKERLLAINPEASIHTIEGYYTAETSASFHLEEYDYIIDAIDALRDKASLIQVACQLMKSHNHIRFYSSMGAALRIDPTQVCVSEFWKIKGDALARALRNKFKQTRSFPACKFLCVHSEEVPLQNRVAGVLSDGDRAHNKVSANGSLCHITATFGMTLSGLVIQDIYRKSHM